MNTVTSMTQLLSNLKSKHKFGIAFSSIFCLMLIQYNSESFAENFTPSSELSRKLTALDGKEFFLLQNGYSCRGFGPGATPQPSWRGRLEIRAGAVLDWGDRCTNQGLPADLSQLKIGFWGRTVAYHGVTYRRMRDVEAQLARAAAVPQPLRPAN